MSHIPCRNGAACTRSDCWFAHPDGRASGGVGVGGAPSTRSFGGSRGGGGGGGGGGGNVCRFGRTCHREGCYYSHPDGRDIDDQPPAGAISAGPGAAQLAKSASPVEFNPDDWEEYQDEEEEFIAAQGALECECCGGRPFECATPSCQAAGKCGCMLGEVDDEEEDDALRDEWFPAFRDCPCCAGTIYRCKKLQDDCVSGNCFCSLQKNAAPVQ